MGSARDEALRVWLKRDVIDIGKSADGEDDTR